MSAAGTAEVLGRYSGQSPLTRLFLWARWHWTPYGEISRLLPKRGRILDAGCGHGLLALTLALQSPARRVTAVDHDPGRIASARRAGRGIRGLEFKTGDFTRPPAGKFEGMVFMDVLHYLPWKAQEALLKGAARQLGRGGTLVFRELGADPSGFSFWNKLHERVMTGLGLTKAGGLHFRTREGWRALARDAGFRVEDKPMSKPPFADILYRCVKP